MRQPKQENYFLVLNNRRHSASRDMYNDGIKHEANILAKIERDQKEAKDRILARMKEITTLTFTVSTYLLKLHDLKFTIDGGIAEYIPEFDPCIANNQFKRELELTKCINLAFKRWVYLLQQITEAEQKKRDSSELMQGSEITDDTSSPVFEDVANAAE